MKKVKNKDALKVQVDKSKWGKGCNTYSTAPDFYYDKYFACSDCGAKEVWRAKDQKFWYEELLGNINSVAKLCHSCRKNRRNEKLEQKEHMEKMSLKQPHPNEKIFKNT